MLVLKQTQTVSIIMLFSSVTMLMWSYFQFAFDSVMDMNEYLFSNIDLNNTMKVEHCNVMEALDYTVI